MNNASDRASGAGSATRDAQADAAGTHADAPRAQADAAGTHADAPGTQAEGTQAEGTQAEGTQPDSSATRADATRPPTTRASASRSAAAVATRPVGQPAARPPPKPRPPAERTAERREAAGKAAAQPAHTLVETVRGREAFLGLRGAWDAALAAGPDPSPALEHDFLRIWLENVASSRAPLTVVARREGRIAAALGLFVEDGHVDGVPARIARGWSNSHSTRGGLLLGSGGPDAIPALVREAVGLGWDVLRLRDLPRESGVLERVADALRDAGCAVALDRPMDSPWIPLPASREELEKRLDGHFRQNLRRRRRRLEEHGPVALEIVTGGDALDAALEDAFVLEASGWKTGSAVRARPELVGFYTAWARLLARQGRLRLSFLKVGERRIAFQFAFVAQRRWWLPKVGYDEAWAECSPGQLLVREVLGRCIDEKLEAFEFLGHSMPWKRDWTPMVHPHSSLWAFRPTVRGRLARVVRAELRPRAASALGLLRRQSAALQGSVVPWRGRVPALRERAAGLLAWVRRPPAGGDEK